jgi:pimeloyl-ACP methyl ester carboxylesterase
MTFKPTLSNALLLSAALIISSAGCGNTLYNLAKKSERGSADLIEKSVQIGPHKMVYLETGKGETILLIHGFGGDKDNWTRFAKHLYKDYRVIIPDMPGFGESSRIETEDYSVQKQAERLSLFVKELGLENFHMAGNSLGGWITCWYALNNQSKVKSITLFNSAGVTSPQKSEHELNVEKGYNALLVQNVKDYDRLMNFVFVDPPYIPGPLKKRFSEEAAKSRVFNEKIWKDIFKNMPMLEPHLGRINIPVMVIWGDTDRVIHLSAADVFVKGIKGSQKHIIERCGHLPMVEKPELSADIMKGFMAGTK